MVREQGLFSPVWTVSDKGSFVRLVNLETKLTPRLLGWGPLTLNGYRLGGGGSVYGGVFLWLVFANLSSDNELWVAPWKQHSQHLHGTTYVSREHSSASHEHELSPGSQALQVHIPAREMPCPKWCPLSGPWGTLCCCLHWHLSMMNDSQHVGHREIFLSGSLW